jgi:uncharacterized protein (DUF2147 family)
MQRGLFRVMWMLLCAGAMAASALADDAPSRVLGNWLTEPKDGIIQISQASDGSLQGKIVGGDSPGKVDSNNPDPAKRNLVLRGQVIMQGFKYDGAGKWSGGTIYDPKGGSTYKCKIELRDDGTLKVRGYIGFSLLGKTQVWTRYSGTSMDLPKAAQ